MIRNIGDVDAAFRNGGTILEAEYYTPHLAHAPMEPPVAVVDIREGKAYCWAPTQIRNRFKRHSPIFLGIKPEDVICHVTLLGGGFGRKSFQDFIAEAAVLSQKLHKPVKIVWSREDDIHFCFFHPSAAMYLKAAVGPHGKPSAWLQRSVFQGSASMTDTEVLYPGQDEIDNGWTDVPFDIPNQRAESGPRRLPRPDRMGAQRDQYISCVRDAFVCR